MPSPRPQPPRAVSIEYDGSGASPAAYRKVLRGGRHRAQGTPVVIRNGLPPFRPYRYKGEHRDDRPARPAGE